ncbi:prepilin-type N-terminal cleavage/methylation domain-containing protein [Rickettsiales bacterium]|nr:prepilin-type N-terminal cleavage/methylation domain-containing protein [Rickettsiales bacterium]MDB2550354.1 prepilin-type N-terminal cleavage/methylation domain-containing protein [Rickettsiales bacterium]
MKKNHKLGFSLVEISVVVLIIGVLIAAITTGTDLVKRSKTASAQNLSSNTAIYGMKDLVLWFEPALPNSFDDESEGESLSLWSNNSPFYSIGSAVADGANPIPVYSKDAINHIPAVKFTAVDQRLIINDVSNLLEQSDLSIFIVEDRDNSLTTTRRIISSTGTNGLNIYYNASDNFTADNESGTAASSSAFTGANLHYLSLFDNNGGGNFEINGNIIIREGFYHYLNKKLPQAAAMPAPSTTIDSTTPYQFDPNSIGVLRLGHDSQSYMGNIAEIIIFNRRLRKSELHDIFRYFEAKYNLSLSAT